jgi:hypothetical protein
MDDVDVTIHTTAANAAEQILSRSFAVYRVNANTANRIRDAHRVAIKFFHEASTPTASTATATAPNNKELFTNRYQRIVNGNLHGYNVLPSKELFRTWYKDDGGGDKDDDGKEEEQQQQQQQHQQWPSEDLRKNTLLLAKDLHRLLTECVRHIIVLKKNQQRRHICDSPTTSNTSQEEVAEFIPFPPRKRFRTPSSSSSSSNNDKNNDEINLPWSCRRNPHGCPLDYFFYHNRNPNSINCSEHIDRGVLVVVCLTDVPGLEVLSSSSVSSSPASSLPLSKTRKFICPELLVHNANLYKERTDSDACSDLVCIMTGNQLSQLLMSTRETTLTGSNATTTTTNKKASRIISEADYYPPACVHRVRNHLKRARLSISYELRLDWLAQVDP